MLERAPAVFLLALLPLSSLGQRQKPEMAETASVEQLTAMLTADSGKDDGQIAGQLSGLQLSERLSPASVTQLNAALPGEKARQALTVLADSAALLQPPQAEVVANPPPDAATLRQMLVNIVNYANSTLHGLPNFIATRATSAFEDRPQEDVQESNATVSYSYLPLHVVRRQSMQVTYRNGHEVLEASGKEERTSPTAHGLRTTGEFGPFLSTVLADAVKGKITWARWERGIDGTDAVFHYQVNQAASHYFVQFCCVRDNGLESIATKVFTEKAGYTGEVVFNPASGAVMRVSLQAELTPGELVSSAGMVVDYAPLQVGDKSVVLPIKSVSILKAHTTAPPEGMHTAIFNGPAKTFLNDVAFENYHQFRGEMRIVSDGSGSAPR